MSSFWLVECLVCMGRFSEAEALLQRLEHTASDLGLFSEEYDTEWKHSLGNYPQAFTHIGYVNSVMSLIRAEKERDRNEEKHARRFSVTALLNWASEIRLKKFPDSSVVSDIILEERIIHRMISNMVSCALTENHLIRCFPFFKRTIPVWLIRWKT